MPAESLSFERAADFYDETRGFPPGVETHAAQLIVDVGGLSTESHVLEVGVGTGRIAIPVLPHVGHYTGVDLAVPMMQKLREKPGGQQVGLIAGDITALPLRGGYFDAVIAVHVFHLVPGWRQALQEVGRVLKADGVLLDCYNSSKHHNVFRPLWDAWNAAIPSQKRDPIGVNTQENPEYLTDAGFEPMSETQHYAYEVKLKPSEFLRRLRQRIWSRLWLLSDEDLEKGITAIEDVMPQHFPDIEAEIPVTEGFYVQPYRSVG